MNEIRKKLLVSVILIIIYDLVCYFTNSIITKNALETWLNIMTISLSFFASIYELILVFNTKIDLNKHKKFILISSIIFFCDNLISGIIGFTINGKLENKEKKEDRELPLIELEEYTNKYICLIAFIICLSILLFGNSFIKDGITLVLAYVLIFSLMVGIFWKQLVHDFKIFKKYFREYSKLVFKTWGKALLFLVIASLMIQIITGTTQANNQIVLQKSFNSKPIFIAILAMFYAPIAEELMFRGVFRKFIKNKKLFIIISGVVFGLMHVIDDSKTLAEFSYVFVYSILGIYLAGIYAKTNNLCTNIFMHFLQNTLSVIGMIMLMFI